MGRFSPSTSVFPATSHSTNGSTLTIIYHPELVQQAKQWPQYQADSVSPHEKKIERKALTRQHIITSLIWGLHLISDPALGWSRSKEVK
jgi:hypothetical protein